MYQTHKNTFRIAVLVLAGTSFLSACSGSGTDSSAESQAIAENVSGIVLPESVLPEIDANGTIESLADITELPSNPSQNVVAVEPDTTAVDTQVQEPKLSDAPVAGTTRVHFDIVVPAYQSNELQVQLKWGDKQLFAAWVVDELWTIEDDFPASTENQLVVSFMDGNGAINLGSYQAQYRTGSNAAEAFTITAEQFDTNRWDDDADGISNLEELMSSSSVGQSTPTTEPLEQLLPVPTDVELRADKIFRIRWEPTTAADYYRVLENPDGVSGYTDISGELDASVDHFDHRVALHKRVNARYIVEACNATGCTLSVQQLIESTLDDSIGYMKASNTDAQDGFGQSVSLSADGNTMAVSALDEDSAATGVNGDQTDNSIADSGAVYVFVRSNDKWQQQAYLKSSNPAAGVDFGISISLSADGNTLAVGASREDSKEGSVYVYVRSGAAWQQQAFLKSSSALLMAESTCCDSSFGVLFGVRVSLSDDGNTLAVVASGEHRGEIGINGDQTNDSDVFTGSGAVYVFVRSGTVWQQQAQFKSSANTRGGSRDFGRAVSLSGDGNTLAVGVYDTASVPVVVSGAPVSALPASISTRGASFSASYYYGAVYVFTRTNENWKQQALLRNIDGSLGSYGWSVSLNKDGNTLAIAALGGVDIQERIGGIWQGQVHLEGYTGSVTLSADGNTLATGAPGENSASTGLAGYQGTEISREGSGAVNVFERRDGVWQEPVYVKASNTYFYNHFGGSIALSADGDILAVGARGESGTSTGFDGDQTQTGGDNWGAGAVYLY